MTNMNLYKATKNLKTKEQEPKVFSIVLEDPETSDFQLFMNVSFELQSAIEEAKDEWLKTADKFINKDDLQPVMWQELSVSQLLPLCVDTKDKQEYAELNELMTMIVEKKDKKLFKENKDKFNEFQQKYLKEQIK